MSEETIRLYMIPGTGTDYRMFAPQLERFPGMIIPQWLPPLKHKEPISSYARRLAATIDTSSLFLLGGVSLGGMIAQEMALTIKPAAVIMIATCSTSRALPLPQRLAGKFTRALPDAAVKFLFKMMSKAVRSVKKERLAHKDLYAQMLAEMPPSLVRWQSGAATEWTLGVTLGVPVFHIHGKRDGIVPVKNVNPQVVVDQGGHLINVTHAEQVNGYIEECMARASAEQAARREAIG